MIICLACTCNMFAQIQLTPYVDSTVGGLNENNVGVIENRLRTLISQQGLQSGYASRFLLAVKVNVLDSYMTSTVPAKVGQKVMVSFAIGDSETEACFGSCSTEAKGVGDTQEAAMLSAFRNIRITPELQKIIATSKEKIIAYYNQNGSGIIKKAQGLVAGQKWEEALYELNAIPQECACYPQAVAEMNKVYSAQINHDAAQILAEARAVWSADPNPGPAADQAMSILSQINTSAKCYPQAQALMKQIETRVKNVTDTQYANEVAMEKSKLATAAALEKARIQACRDVAVAYAKRKVVVHRHYHWW